MTHPLVLVQPPASFENKSPCLDDRQFGVGLLALAAWLEENDVPVCGIHAPLLMHRGSSADEVVREILMHSPRMVAIGLNWVHFSVGALQLAERIKSAAPDCPVFLGGQHASLFAPEIASQHGGSIDGVIIGEAEIPLLAIYRSLSETGELIESIPGLARPDGRITSPEIVPNVDSLPVYSYRSLSPRPLQEDVAAISTARGACPFQCAWCIEPVVGRVQGRPRLQFHSAEHIADQIEHLVSEGITRFTIQDNFFVGGDERLCELSNVLISRGIRPKHLNIFAHPDSYGEEGFHALAACSARASVDFGVETGSVKVARLNHRHLDPDRVIESITSAIHAHVEPFTWWMVGLPGEDAQALSETEDLIVRTMMAGGVPRWVSPLILFPKTPIHSNPSRFGIEIRFHGFDDYSQFSRITLAEAVLFSDAVTHVAKGCLPDASTEATNQIRQCVARNIPLLQAFYEYRSWRPDFTNVRQTVTQSFF